MIELKPCPNILCGNSEIEQLELVQEHSNNEDIFYYQCTVCGCVPIGESNSRKKAKEMWNNRPTEKAFEAHAVEVLAEKCHYNSELWDENRDMPEWEEIDELRKNRYRGEARELLGIKEGE